MKAYIEDSVDVNGGFIDQKPAYDMIVNAWVALHLDVKVVVGWVKWRALEQDGKVVGSYNTNSMLRSMIYEVELPDVQVKDYAEIS